MHSGYTFFCQYVWSLGIEPTTFALLTQCSNHWATGTPHLLSVNTVLVGRVSFLQHHHSPHIKLPRYVVQHGIGTRYWHCDHLAITYNRLHLLAVIDFVIVVVTVRWKGPERAGLNSSEISAGRCYRDREAQIQTQDHSTNFLQPILGLIPWHSLQPTEVDQRPINKTFKDFSHISEVCLQNNIKAAA